MSSMSEMLSQLSSSEKQELLRALEKEAEETKMGTLGMAVFYERAGYTQETFPKPPEGFTLEFKIAPATKKDPQEPYAKLRMRANSRERQLGLERLSAWISEHNLNKTHSVPASVHLTK